MCSNGSGNRKERPQAIYFGRLDGFAEMGRLDRGGPGLCGLSERFPIRQEVRRFYRPREGRDLRRLTGYQEVREVRAPPLTVAPEHTSEAGRWAAVLSWEYMVYILTIMFYNRDLYT